MIPEVRRLGVIAASAAALNDELTILLNADRPSDTRAALQRCAWLAAQMTNYAGRRGARASAASAERLMRDKPVTWRAV